MGTRTVRLDEPTDQLLRKLRRGTGLSISEVLKRGVRAYSEQAASRGEMNPYEIFRRIDLGAGGWAAAPARGAKSALRETLARKHLR